LTGEKNRQRDAFLGLRPKASSAEHQAPEENISLIQSAPERSGALSRDGRRWMISSSSSSPAPRKEGEHWAGVEEDESNLLDGPDPWLNPVMKIEPRAVEKITNVTTRTRILVFLGFEFL